MPQPLHNKRHILLFAAAAAAVSGLSPHVVSQPGYWPASVQMTGFWLVRDMHMHTAWQQQQQQPQSSLQQQQQQSPLLQQQQQGCQLPVDLEQFICSCTLQQSTASDAGAAVAGAAGNCKGLLLIDFGSMGCLGLLPDPMTLVTVLMTALESINW